MLALSRPQRSAQELAGWRAQAATERDSWGVSSDYVRETRSAALEAFDWLAGSTAVAPATGETRPADDASVVAELLRADRLAETGDERHPPRHWGAVWRVLAWHLLDPDVETPL